MLAVSVLMTAVVFCAITVSPKHLEISVKRSKVSDEKDT